MVGNALQQHTDDGKVTKVRVRMINQMVKKRLCHFRENTAQTECSENREREGVGEAMR